MKQSSSDGGCIPGQDNQRLKKHPLYLILLISPITWYKCFALVFYSTRSRTSSTAILQYSILLLALVLLGVSSYLLYALGDEAGQYSLYLTNVASNSTSMAEGKQLFDELIWRTVLKTFFLGVTCGLLQACNFFLAAQWRQRLCDRFEELLLECPNGCVLYHASQTDDDMCKVITNDVKQFTSNFASVLFGSMFLMGVLSIFPLIITVCVTLVRVTNGDATGILICFVAFLFCIVMIVPTTQIYNRNLISQSKVNGRLLGYLERLQSHAQCIVLYGSQRVELEFLKRLISNVCKSLYWGSISFILINFSMLLSFLMMSLCTYVIPPIVFFFIQKIQNVELAKNLVIAIPFYSVLIGLICELIYVLEFALITVTMGDHLWRMLNHLEQLTKQHRNRLTHERTSGIREDNADLFVLQHLNISVPGVPNALLLQSGVNLTARRNESVLVCGPSGCGKTTLFRICAGLQSIDAKKIILPSRDHLLFIPQRPYLPLGSLRFQALFLLEDRSNINEKDILRLFYSVNLQYLLGRYSLDTIVDWSVVLSVGEQQRLSFIRLFALFTLSTNRDQLLKKTLIFLDESTSAVDTKTEKEIYYYLNELGVWFVTISHRSSLVHLHSKSLKFSSDTTNREEKIERQNTEVHISIPSKIEEEDKPIQRKQCDFSFDQKNIASWKILLDIYKFIHLPFQSGDQKLRIQTIVAWLFTLTMIGLAAWTYTDFLDLSALFYGGLSNYASGSITIDQGKELIRSNIVKYIIILVVNLFTYVLSIGGGRILATLYTHRQLNYLAHLLLDSSDQENGNNLLYHSRDLSVIPHFLAHDVTQLNIELFNLTVGQIYYTGIIGQTAFIIVSTILVSKQSGGSTGNLIAYLTAFGFFFVMSILSALFNRWSTRDEMQFIQFANAQKRIDTHSKEIAFSGDDVCREEKNQLRTKLDSSVRSQIHNGYFFSCIIGIVKLSIFSVYLISFAIPAAIFFHSSYAQGVADPSTAQTFLTLSVYMNTLYASLSFAMYFGDPIRRIQSIGIRVVGYLGQLREIQMHHLQLAIEEEKRGRRLYIEPKLNEPSLVLEHVDIRIPQWSDVLVSNINLTLHSSENLIITGRSGCGKSTLLRLLAGLISNESEMNNSIISLIPRQNILILSQQLYLIRGTLREQLSYLRQAYGLTILTDDTAAAKLLDELGLLYLLDRYSMDGERHMWSEILSIGEQQRLMMVTAILVGSDTLRLFILDETTSACDNKTEIAIYEYLQRSNFQFLSISHRKEIKKYHSRQMNIENGHAILTTIDLNTSF